MKYRVMITSLCGGNPNEKIQYYCANDGQKSMYCDAMLSAEASSKYILAHFPIDEIITIGSKATYDPEDELVPMRLVDGKSFFASDISELSHYSLFRYRLAQYLEELRIEDQDLRALIGEEEQKEIKSFLKKFFNDFVQDYPRARFNRLFDILMDHADLRATLFQKLEEEIPAYQTSPERYRQWVKYYLYDQLKDSNKLELLEGNEDVKIRFVPTDAGGGIAFADRIISDFSASGEPVELELYICIQSEDAGDTFVLLNLMDIVRAMPASRMEIVRIATTTRTADDFAHEISDQTSFFSVSDLIAGTRAFLQYGKTQLLFDYWEHQDREDPYIDKLLYAMRNIDIGISLCDIGDIERGISSLRRLFSEKWHPGDDFFEKCMAIVIEGIKQDYGKLLDDDEISFIDLVKWAYRKGFWQQTLTLIESRAPRDFVSRGIYYYADSKEAKAEVIEILGQIYCDLRPFEKYRLRDVDHFFIKMYGRRRTSRTDDNERHQREYTDLRISDLHNTDEEVVTAYTLCEDTDLLRNLLYAYYHLGDVRNATNHASDEMNGFAGVMTDSDVGERMNIIRQAIDTFIYYYEKTLEEVAGADNHILKVTTEELRERAATMTPTRYWKS